jgi:hypothetical protein
VTEDVAHDFYGHAFVDLPRSVAVAKGVATDAVERKAGNTSVLYQDMPDGGRTR